MSFHGVSHPVLIEEEKDISHVQYAADFSTNWIFVQGHSLFKNRLCGKKRPIHFNALVFLTSRTYQSYSRCDTMRLKLIPMDKDTSLSAKFCFSLNVFFFLSLIDKPFFHLNTSVNCMHFLVFILFYFFFVWCYVFVLSLNFSSFLHCNYNTSLFDFF